ncbi:hypothetical protein H8B02_19055 [Bradyrhizobium sp. Pear77]|uniref:hypothetical protein n=1 Tax=Bradyrhizobium TaxID=374 RepID=UPI001E292444|nr:MULTISPECIES: hypothetical protein [Bradyrhizobium]MCC8955451.1 hypothetical protein [Bradyrhizobium altum]MCC8965231.1 hypothetical protein [Bradyrhizobium oropedii]
MTDHGDTFPAAGTIAGTTVQSSCCTTVIDTNRGWLELIRIDATGSRELFRSANPLVGDRITTQHDRFGGTTSQSTRTATGVIEIMRRLGEIALSPSAQRLSDPARRVRKVA